MGIYFQFYFIYDVLTPAMEDYDLLLDYDP